MFWILWWNDFYLLNFWTCRQIFSLKHVSRQRKYLPEVILVEKLHLMNQGMKRKFKKKIKLLPFLIVKVWVIPSGNVTLEQVTENLEKTQITDLKCIGHNFKNSLYSPQHHITNDIKVYAGSYGWLSML